MRLFLLCLKLSNFNGAMVKKAERSLNGRNFEKCFVTFNKNPFVSCLCDPSLLSEGKVFYLFIIMDGKFSDLMILA